MKAIPSRLKVKNLTRFKVILVALSILLFADQGTQAAPRPDPGTSRSKILDRIDRTVAEATELWQHAMNELRREKLLVTFGFDSGGGDNALRALGLNLGADELLFTEGLATKVKAHMVDAYPRTRLVNIDAALANDDVDAGDLAAMGLDGAVELAMKKVRAKKAIIVQFAKQPDGTYRILGRIIDPRFAEERPVDIDPYDSSRTLAEEEKAAEIFRAVAERMKGVAAMGAPIFTVNVLGLTDNRSIRKITRGLEDLPDVKYAEADDARGGFASIEVEYDGAIMDLSIDLEDLIRDELEMRPRTLVAAGGKIQIQILEAADPPAWRRLTDPKVPGAEDLQKLFKAYYREKGEPSVAVMIQEVNHVEVVRSKYDAAPTRPQWEVRLTDTLSPEYLALENEMAGVLIEAGMRVIDGRAMRERLRAELVQGVGADDAVVQQAEIDAAFADMDDIDMIIVARAGDIAAPKDDDDDKAADPGVAPPITFRARLQDPPRLLGVSTWPSREAFEDPEFKVDSADLKDISQFLAGRILDTYYRTTLVDGSSILTEIEGAANLGQVQQIADVLESTIPGVLSVSGIKFNRGQATFNLRFEGNYNDLVERIQSAVETLPVEHDAAVSKPGLLMLRLK